MSSKLKFNYLKFRDQVNATFGYGSYTKFAAENGISKSQLLSWINGKTENGPRSDSWDKLIKAFAKQGKHINISDFMEMENDTMQKPYSTLNESLPFPESEKDAMVLALTKEKQCLEELLMEKSKEILKQKELILKLRAENRKLKKEIKDLTPN
ncbi:MAG: hypothetical protein LBQ39_07880 [Tannerellaceae bacterium]|jgi:hypothetical protein|nr:hypothetical protein [Tannerellaceae bacterium]